MSSFINFKNYCGYTPMAANSPLTQQSSIYAMTFDELQNTLGGSGKDFGSMNMDELIKNIWADEETQAMTSNSSFAINGGVANNGNLQKQGSLTLPRTISQKTVDEVWRELLKENGVNGRFKDVELIKESNLQTQERQAALGEMTLEEFLNRAGVVAENNRTQPIGRRWNDDQSSIVFGFKNPNQNQGFNQQPKPQKILPKKAAFNFASSVNLVNDGQMGSSVNGVSVIGKTDHSIKSNVVRARSPSDLFPNSNLDTSPSPPSYAYGEGDLNGRKKSGTLEKVVERRRKRMIKNRESAARSRARKQAYTLELEAEVAKLKELNYELQKKQDEIMESQNSKIAEKMKFWGSRRLCLRRTLTGPW